MNNLPLKTSLAGQKTSGGVLITQLRFSTLPAPPAAPADVILLTDPAAPPLQTLHRLVDARPAGRSPTPPGGLAAARPADAVIDLFK